ncbi:FKBP-type peptidyl-prolyl cis-trans isomerase [Wenzhouxiangella sp. XN79A]|uniref:FKBP-type peptidyl-prolyl cis-trans isomerase n=1 Tax=Wenzhouxiangella sp. XN79A TaxID=2724193 RepID=UPI00144A8856|nr:FKBP-type peptidyl-prolyl cis-trans isomerase [Wenzhouxiangella sp. XN79A]NKI35953.1 FKBP-type peptidyl-prolyl cis-trans isomerase [Wenzhouxiangella sp. XN79A]
MRNIVFKLLVPALAFAPMVVQAQDLESDAGKLGYAIGYEFGSETSQWDVDLEAVLAAIRDANAGREPQVAVSEMREVLAAFNERMRQERMEQFQQLAEENQARADEWLAENRGKSGIVALPSGVQYRVIEEGEGARPNLEDTVTVHYRGSKMDGREFDSSFARGVPAVFQVDSVLEGWQEVLPLMREGAMWQVFLPPELAFGMRGDPPLIGPNEALQFDLRLVRIGEPDPANGN